ncbi:MAG: ATP-binding protein [Deltaproteobacteria bacterium]|nr:ATP-binding protein [Deltaproteobacteria bacterium]
MTNPVPDGTSHPDQSWRGLRLRWWGTILGLLAGGFDTAVMSAIGVTFAVNAWDARPLIAAYFGISFAVLGYLIGMLIEGRRRERRTAALLQAQTEAIAAARARGAQQEKLAALGQLAATIAHEVRNPLGIMRSAAQTLSETLPPSGADARRASDFIIAEIDRLANVVNSILAYARPLQLAPRAVPVNELLDRALLLAGGDLGARRVQVQRSTNAATPPVFADADLISQVLLGLLGNAAEAMPDGGRVTLDAVALADAVQLRVADSGPGVPAELRARIFDPFVTTRPRGTGLGLAIARQIVEAHGGRIEVGTGPDGGALFAVTLPVAKAALAA